MTRTDFLRTLLAAPVAAVAAVVVPRADAPTLPLSYRGWLTPYEPPIVPEVQVLDFVDGADIARDVQALNLETGQVQVILMDGDDQWTGAGKVITFVDGAGQRWDSRDYAK